MRRMSGLPGPKMPVLNVRHNIPPLANWKWEDRSHLVGTSPHPFGMTKAFVNSLYSVMVIETLIDGQAITHLMIRRHDNEPARNWKHLQRIKNELCGYDAIAVEVFPPNGEVVDQANLTHLWLLPEGFNLPFNLKAWMAASQAAKREALLFTEGDAPCPTPSES